MNPSPWKTSAASPPWTWTVSEDLLDELEDDEPGGVDSEAHGLWESRLSETESFIGRILDRLDEPEEDDDD